jgi:imidazolonepropionase-like amidohydrolase
MTTFAIHNCEIFDPKETFTGRQTIVVADGLISSIEPADRFAGQGLEVADVEGAVVTPGIVDTHVHLAFDGTADSVWVVDPDPSAHALMAFHHANLNLRAGITTVRDLGAQTLAVLAVRDAIEKYRLPGSRVFACGKAVTSTGGHGWNSSFEADGPDAVRAAVRKVVKTGADCVKLYATGFPNVEPEGYAGYQMTPAELAAAVDEAHQRKKLVAVHACNEQSVLAAVQAGADSIEHGIRLGDSTLELMAKQGTALGPTLACVDEFTAEPGTASCASMESAAAYELAARALGLGVNVILASDSGCIAPASARTELAAFAAAGMDERTVLSSATDRAAASIGLTDCGHLAPGLRADIVAWVDEPYGETRLVVKAGTPHHF